MISWIRTVTVPFLRLVRLRNWWFAKIPPLLAVAYAMLLLRPPAAGRAFVSIAAALISLASLASFGYVINDIFDIGEDMRSGKANAAASLSPGRRFLVCSLLMGTGFIPWLWNGFGLAAALVLAANFILPLMYSIPPLRLKGRGCWGVLADAAGVHAVPTFFMAIAFANVLKPSPQERLLITASFVAWSFLAGLRGILIHQRQDRERDMLTGQETLAVRHTQDWLHVRVRGLVFPLEALAMGVLAVILIPKAPLVLCILLAYAAFDLIRHRTWKMRFDPMPGSSGTYVPGADFYEVWLPLSLVFTMAFAEIAYLAFLAMHAALFWESVRQRAHEINSVLDEQRRKNREGIGN